MKRDNEVLQAISKLDDSDRIDSYFELAKIYLELNQPANALTIIKNVTVLVEKSKYEEDKAILSLYYAKLGNETEALRFLQESIKDLTWKTGKPEYTQGRIIDKVIEAYRVLGKDKEANEILEKQGVFGESETQIEIAKGYLAKGNLNQAKELFEKALSKLNPTDYSDSFDLGNLIEIYIKLGELDNAEKLAKSLTGSNYMQQQQLFSRPLKRA